MEVCVFREGLNHIGECHIRASGYRLSIKKRIHINTGDNNQQLPPLTLCLEAVAADPHRD